MTSARNPNNPTLVGEEFRPVTPEDGPNFRIASTSDAVVQTLVSTGSGARPTLAALLNMDTIGGSVVIETMPAGAEGQAVTTTVLRPNGIQNAGPSIQPWMVSTAGTSAAQILSVLAQATPDVASYVYNNVDINGLNPQLNFPTTGLFVGRRIVDVRVVVIASDPMADPRDDLSAGIEGYTDAANTVAGPRATLLSGVSGWNVALQKVAGGTQEVYPTAGTFWTPARLDAYDHAADPTKPTVDVSAGPYTSIGGGTNTMRIYQVWLEVDHCPEVRYSVDMVYPQQTGPRWATYTPTHPDGVTTGFTTPGAPFTMIIRQARFGNVGRPSHVAADYTLFVPYLQGSNGDTDFGVTQYDDVAMDTTGLVDDLGSPRKDRMVGFDMRDGSGHSDATGQGYARVVRVEPRQVAQADPADYYVHQQFSNAASDDYAGVIIPLIYVPAFPAAGTGPTFVAELRRQSDDHLMATATMTWAEFADAAFPDVGGGWHNAQIPFDGGAVALVAGTQYYLTFIHDVLSPTPDGVGGFEVGVLTTSSGGTETIPDGRSSYRGLTDAAVFGGTDSPWTSLNTISDVAVVLYLSIDVPSGFSGIAASVDIETHDCGIVGIGYAALRWSPISPLASFDYYEVQRLDDHDSIWRTIATIRSIGTSGFYDFEGRLGDVSQYRIRTVSSAGIVSDWSAPVSVTPPVDGCGYTFTSNIINAGSIGLMVAYADVYNTGRIASRTFQFPEAAEVKRQAIYGRDDYVSFIPANRRGDEFTRRLLIDALGTPPTPPPGSADPIRDLSRAPIPYVCVRDESGNRWFANVVVSEYSITQPGSFEYVTVAIGERVTVPSVADF